MTEVDSYLFPALVALSLFLYRSLTRRLRREIAKQKALDLANPGKAFETAAISPQINRLRQNFIGVTRSHRAFACGRKERIVTARCAVTQLSFFRKLHADSPTSCEQRHSEFASF